MSRASISSSRTVRASIGSIARPARSSCVLRDRPVRTSSSNNRPLHLENYVRIVAFAPDLRKVPFHGVIEFLCYSSTIELLLLLILINGSYQSLKALLRNRHQPYSYCRTQIHAKSPRGSVPLIKTINDPG